MTGVRSNFILHASTTPQKKKITWARNFTPKKYLTKIKISYPKRFIHINTYLFNQADSSNARFWINKQNCYVCWCFFIFLMLHIYTQVLILYFLRPKKIREISLDPQTTDVNFQPDKIYWTPVMHVLWVYPLGVRSWQKSISQAERDLFLI